MHYIASKIHWEVIIWQCNVHVFVYDVHCAGDKGNRVIIFQHYIQSV